MLTPYALGDVYLTSQVSLIDLNPQGYLASGRDSTTNTRLNLKNFYHAFDECRICPLLSLIARPTNSAHYGLHKSGPDRFLLDIDQDRSHLLEIDLTGPY
jgi:hypothetical protein